MRPNRGKCGMRRAGYCMPACALALLAMLAQIGSYAHLASGEHVRCVEHGELVDVGHAPTPSAAPERRAGGRTLVAATSDAHGHEHCLVAPHRRDHATQSFARTSISSAQLPFFARRVEALAPPRPIPLILLAPKSSPPA